MIKIGIECESIEAAQTWGVGRELFNLLKQISSRPELEKDFKFVLYFKSSIPNHKFLKNPIFESKIVRPALGSFSLYYYLFLPIALRQDRLDAVYFPNYMLPLIFCGRSLVSLTEDVYREIKNRDLPFRYRLAYRIFSGWAAKRATGIYAYTETSKKEIARLFGISADRIFVNYHGVETVAGEEYSLSASEFGLYIGQAFPRRHLKETLLAFEKISSKHPQLKFVAVGKDKYIPPIIKNLAGEINKRLGSEKIIYKEYVSEEELQALYRKARFIVYVSDSEAFGLPPLEGLAYGTVPIVADAPVNREIYGDNAFFVRGAISTETIAEAMNQALTDEVKIKDIKSKASKITAKFSWPEHADRFLKIIGAIAKK